MGRPFHINKDVCALFVIDMQKYFCDDDGRACVPGADILKTKIKRRINVFVNANQPIIFTRHIDTPGGLMEKCKNFDIAMGFRKSGQKGSHIQFIGVAKRKKRRVTVITNQSHFALKTMKSMIEQSG